MSKYAQQIRGVLVRDEEAMPVMLDVTVQELAAEPGREAIGRVGISLARGQRVKDGNYTLLYNLTGKQEESLIRIEDGIILNPSRTDRSSSRTPNKGFPRSEAARLRKEP
jgi:hypothetical protein